MADAAVVACSWRGDERDDYDRACGLVSDDAGNNIGGSEIVIEDVRAVVWDMGGAGTADVFLKTTSHLILVRGWFDSSGDLERVLSLAELPVAFPAVAGLVEIRGANALVILSAIESGACVTDTHVTGTARPDAAAMTTESSGLLVEVPSGTYRCVLDTVRLANDEARRCHMIRQ